MKMRRILLVFAAVILCGCTAIEPISTNETTETSTLEDKTSVSLPVSDSTDTEPFTPSYATTTVTTRKNFTVAPETTTQTTTLPPETTTEATTTTVTTTEASKTSPTSSFTPITAAADAAMGEYERFCAQAGNAYCKFGDSGILVVDYKGHYRGLMPTFAESYMPQQFANAVNKLKSENPNVNVYEMVIPTQAQFYTPSSQPRFSSDQTANIREIIPYLKDVIHVDACDVLYSHRDEDIYARTDHHWTALGAYYAAQAFCKASGVNVPDINNFTKDTFDNYVGTLYGYSNNLNLKNDPEEFFYYKPKSDYTAYYYKNDCTLDYACAGIHTLFIDVDVNNAYSVFFGGDDKIVRVKTSCNNGRSLLLIKDSYGNAEVPFYIDSYENIYVCDMRYFSGDINNYIETNAITDVLFTMCSSSALGQNEERMEAVLS